MLFCMSVTYLFRANLSEVKSSADGEKVRGVLQRRPGLGKVRFRRVLLHPHLSLGPAMQAHQTATFVRGLALYFIPLNTC
jgi:hypothetical protein